MQSGLAGSWWLPVGLLILLAVCAWPASAGGSPLSGVTQISVGESHACARTASGGAVCWGSNGSGQLGDNTLEHRFLPVPVVGLSSGVVEVAAGREHSCARMQDGSLRCWGRNTWGQLGDGTTQLRRTPVAVINLPVAARRVVTGSAHSCALTVNDTVFCWGYNDYGQLGTGNTNHLSQPTQINNGFSIAELHAGFWHNCLIRNSGQVSCWGVFNRSCGFQGCAFQFDVSPRNIPGLASGVARLATGQFHNCVLGTNGVVRCWGDNYEGQLGSIGDNNPNPLTLFEIAGLSEGVAELTAGHRSSCAVMADGGSRCWGGNGSGVIGDGTTNYAYPPVPTLGLSNVAQIGIGDRFACARDQAGRVRCWGDNTVGQLGDGEPWFRPAPVQVAGLGSGVSSISVGWRQGCAVLTGGQLRCWGSNGYGEVGDGSTTRRPTPVPVTLPGAASAARVAAGDDHSCALSTGGAVSCWGRNDRGQLGVGDQNPRLVPTGVLTLGSGVAEVTAGVRHSCAVTVTGAARCWGSNLDGELGHGGPVTFMTSPVTPFGLTSGVSRISGGGGHSCAISGTGPMRCWGANGRGQLGIGNFEKQTQPVTIGFPNSGLSALGTGDQHSCAIASGALWCWGSNLDGQLRNGFSGSSQSTPAPVQALSSGVTAVSAGFRHTCAVGSGGAAYCWGDNGSGTLGDGSFTRRLQPTPVSGLGSGVVQVAAGGSHSCALTQAGAVWCWGSNREGQLGIGLRPLGIPAPVLSGDPIFASGFE